MDNSTKVFTVDKFRGLNEAADGFTELKMGEASRIENFDITDGLNLKTRAGVRRGIAADERYSVLEILGMWSGMLDGEDTLILSVYMYDNRQSTSDVRLRAYRIEDGGFVLHHDFNTNVLTRQRTKLFQFGGIVYAIVGETFCKYDPDSGFASVTPYAPRVLIGTDPASGGGTTLENINLITSERRVEYNADGQTTAYKLPAEAFSITAIWVDNIRFDSDGDPSGDHALGKYDVNTSTFTFNNAPQKGVGNVVIQYWADDSSAKENREKILGCKLAESYNGSADTRLFVAGNGTNICYYTGLTDAGAPDPTYFPAMNEIRVDMDSSEITGLVRHYTKLLVFTRAGAYTITYEPLTLEGGDTVAGFYLRSANRDFGNEVMGQVQTVDNYPRTVTRGGIFEWKITSSFYRDERNAKRISQRVDKTFKKAAVENVVTCDDNYNKNYLVFLNDSEGTVLVNRYGIGGEELWTVYKGALFRSIRGAGMCGTVMYMVSEKDVFVFDRDALTDAPETNGGEETAIEAVWESGFHHFGADFRRKYSSILYVSMLAEENSELILTAETDKRDDYLEKTVAWEPNDTPQIKRIRLKTKKFVYYKLKMRVGTKGKRATVLGYDQQVRFASMAK
jgi:hypothetical protein